MIEKKPFGRTGHLSTRTIFGAAALAAVSQDEADRALDELLSYGVNHIDTAASYGDSELRVGPWMEQHRDLFFLATKTGKRDYAGAREEIRRSLERLRVDQIDLIQLHNLVEPDEWSTALGPGGALEAAVEARSDGLVRFIGVTGHGLSVARMHLAALERFPFDSVLLPYNYLMMKNLAYAADFERLLEVCVQRAVAVQTIKGITVGPWRDQQRTARTWYEPLQEQRAIDRSVGWVLGRPEVFLNTVGDVGILPMVLRAAERSSQRPSDEEMERLVAAAHMTPLFA